MLEIIVRSTGSREMDFIKIPLQCSDVLLQCRDQRLNKSLLCKDKNCVKKMNETYSMKCSALSCNILQQSELVFGPEISKSRHAGLILFGLLLQRALSLILCLNWQNENWSGWIIRWVGDKKKRDDIKPGCCHLYVSGHLDGSKRGPTKFSLYICIIR